MIFKSIRTYVNTDERRYLVYSNIDRMGRYVTACVDTETDETVKNKSGRPSTGWPFITIKCAVCWRAILTRLNNTERKINGYKKNDHERFVDV